MGHSLGSAGISRRTQFGNHPGTNPGCRNLSPLFHLCEPQFPHTGKETIEQQCRKDEICLKPFGSDEYRLLKVAIAISSIYGWGNWGPGRVGDMAARWQWGFEFWPSDSVLGFSKGRVVINLALGLNHLWSFFSKIKVIHHHPGWKAVQEGLQSKAAVSFCAYTTKGLGPPCSGPALGISFSRV